MADGPPALREATLELRDGTCLGLSSPSLGNLVHSSENGSSSVDRVRGAVEVQVILVVAVV